MELHNDKSFAANLDQVAIDLISAHQLQNPRDVARSAGNAISELLYRKSVVDFGWCGTPRIMEQHRRLEELKKIDPVAAEFVNAFQRYDMETSVKLAETIIAKLLPPRNPLNTTFNPSNI